MKKTSITIHHSAIYAEKDSPEQFDRIDWSHRNRWNGKTKSELGFYGGYHYLIERSGVVQQFRGILEIGAHNDKGIKFVRGIPRSANYYSIGICFAGNMSRQSLTDKQIEASYKLIKRLQEEHDILDVDIKPHRANKATQCPGTNFPDPVWDYLQDEYKKLKKNSWKDKARDWAVKNKISNGERENDPVTRVELWQTLLNFTNKFLT